MAWITGKTKARNEAAIQAAMGRLLRGDLPPVGGPISRPSPPRPG